MFVSYANLVKCVGDPFLKEVFGDLWKARVGSDQFMWTIEDEFFEWKQVFCSLCRWSYSNDLVYFISCQISSVFYFQSYGRKGEWLRVVANRSILDLIMEKNILHMHSTSIVKIWVSNKNSLLATLQNKNGYLRGRTELVGDGKMHVGIKEDA